ncbi:MAG: HD domain-containing protein [Bacilli bacterium]|jgi:(p)ppGpp synthase/HD superfamily hydrolase|nr:HD domain-containing protein [Bacilli bacterium]
MSVVDRARVIASIAHKDQEDKAGRPYLLHPLAVAEKVETEQEKVVALLHDIVEDSHITIRFIRDVFGKAVAVSSRAP